MKSNFEFLEKYWPALSQMANAAENYLYSDPNACMYKLGILLVDMAIQKSLRIISKHLRLL